MNYEIDALLAKLTEIESGPEHGKTSHITALNDLAWALRESDVKKAFSLLALAEALLKEHPSTLEEAKRLRTLGFLQYVKGDYINALETAESVLTMAQAEGALELQPDIYAVLGCVRWALGELPESIFLFRKQFEFAEKAGDRINSAEALNNISMIYSVSGELQLTVDVLEESLERFQKLNYRRGQALVWNNMGMYLMSIGDHAGALENARRAVETSCDIDNICIELASRDTMGQIHHAMGDYKSALEDFTRTAEVAEEYSFDVDRMNAMLGLGENCRLIGEEEKALASLTSALKLAETLGQKPEIFKCHRLLYELYEGKGDLFLALRHIKKYYSFKEQVFNEEVAVKLKNMQLKCDIESAAKETEIHRLKNIDLQEALNKVNQLSGLLPICAKCKKIRNDAGAWEDVSVYIRDHSEADFSHGLCPDCVTELYPDYADRLRKNRLRGRMPAPEIQPDKGR